MLECRRGEKGKVVKPVCTTNLSEIKRNLLKNMFYKEDVFLFIVTYLKEVEPNRLF